MSDFSVVKKPHHNENREKKKRSKFWQRVYDSRYLWLFALPAFLYFFVFSYLPMYGVVIAFKDYMPSRGIIGSPWVGFKHFRRFFDSYYFWDLMRNTIGINVYSLVVGFPLPIILALALNEVKDGPFKKFTQTATYAPNFISVVVISGMIISFLSPSTGIINHLIELLGFERTAFLQDPRWFKTIYVLSNVWQGTGWASVIYFATLSGVDEQLHEAATIDGATRFQRNLYINIPTIMPTVVILLILNFGSLMAGGFEKILLLQNPLNLQSSNVIATFVYKQGLLDAQYSFAAAVGLFQAVINATLLVVVNQVAKRLGETSLF